MGYMTVVKILNDGWHIIKDHPDTFIENIEKGMHDYSGKIINEYAVGNYANPMSVHRSMHADTPQLLLVHQNAMIDLGTVYEDFREERYETSRVDRHMRNIAAAKRMLEDAEQSIMYEVVRRIENEIEKEAEITDEVIEKHVNESKWVKETNFSAEKIIKVLKKRFKNKVQ